MTGYPAIPLPEDRPASRSAKAARSPSPRDAGELAYLFNLTLLNYVNERGCTLLAVDECLGVLRGCTLGLEQRRADWIAECTR